MGRRGRRRVTDLLDVACAGDEVAAKGRLGDDVLITLGDHARLSTSELVARLAGGRSSKILVAGNTVAAGVDLDRSAQCSDRRDETGSAVDLEV